MVWANAVGAYDPETVSMLSNVFERTIAALPSEQRTDEAKDRLALTILERRR